MNDTDTIDPGALNDPPDPDDDRATHHYAATVADGTAAVYVDGTRVAPMRCIRCGAPDATHDVMRHPLGVGALRLAAYCDPCWSLINRSTDAESA